MTRNGCVERSGGSVRLQNRPSGGLLATIALRSGSTASNLREHRDTRRSR